MPLADFFRQFANEEFEKQVKGFDTEAKKRLLTYTWSGNVRELRRVVRMAVLHTEGDTVTADTLEFDEEPLANDVPSLALEKMEKSQILRALEQADGGCPTSERQPGSKVFGSNPKRFELLKTYLAAAIFGSNRKAFG